MKPVYRPSTTDAEKALLKPTFSSISLPLQY
jgi:hypothetical protein